MNWEFRVLAGVIALGVSAGGGYWQGRRVEKGNTEKYKGHLNECNQSLGLCHGNRDTLSTLLENCNKNTEDFAEQSKREREDMVVRLQRAKEMQADLEKAVAAALAIPLPPDPSDKIREMARRLALQMQGIDR